MTLAPFPISDPDLPVVGTGLPSVASDFRLLTSRFLFIYFMVLPFLAKATAAVPLHQFHVSKCLVEYKAGEQAVQISLQLFIDDLEVALQRQGTKELFLCTEREDEKAEEYLVEYLQQHFLLKADGRALSYEFLGKERSEDLAAVWCYLEITGMEAIRKLTVTNNILMEVFDDQKNIVNIAGPGDKTGFFLLRKGKSTETIEF